MNLYFRLLKVLFAFFLRSRGMELLGESRVRFRVWPNDLDTNGHMNNGRFLTLLDLGRLDLLLRIGTLRTVLKNKWNPVLASAQVRFRRPLNLFQSFEIVTRILCWDEKWIYMEQRMIRGEDVVLHAYLRGVFVSKQGSVPITKLLRAMGIDREPPPMPVAISTWIASERNMAESL